MPVFHIVVHEGHKPQTSKRFQVFDPDTAMRRDAAFTTRQDAREACAVISKLRTDSVFAGATVEEGDNGVDQYI